MSALSNWREEFNLSEVVTGKMTDKEALGKVSEKEGINNKVTINPKLDEAVKEIGGEVISMTEQDTTAQKQRIDMKQMILDRQKLKIRRKDFSQKKREGEDVDSTNASQQANVIAQEETVKQVNEKKRKNALQIQKVIGEGDVHSGQGEKIQKRTKAWMDKKGQKGAPGLDAIRARAAEHKAKRGVKEEVVTERLGGKGYQPYTSLTGKKVSGDWEDSDRGAGNKAKKRAGGKVEKKSPTYKAHVLNKEEVVDEGVMKFVKSIGKKKEKPAKKAEMDKTTEKLHDLRKEKFKTDKQKEHEKYVNFMPHDAHHESVVLDANKKIGDKEKREKMTKELLRLMKHARDQKKNPHLANSYEPEGEAIDERTLSSYIPSDRQGEASAANREYVKAQLKKKEDESTKNRGDLSKRDAGKMAKQRLYNKRIMSMGEDKAFNYVLAKLKAKHGDGVLTKGDKMPELSAAQKKKNDEIRAKRAKEDGRDATEKASDGRYSDRHSNRGSD
jgi:hypothetical protein